MKTLKRCTYCNTLKEFIEFHKQKTTKDGFSFKCKGCKKTYDKQQRRKNTAYLRHAKQWRDDNPKLVKEYKEKWRKSNPNKVYLSRKKYRLKNPDIEAAHSAIKSALKSGRIQKPLQCSQCPDTERIEAHHPDYSKPLDVVWLCRKCHIETHARRQEK